LGREVERVREEEEEGGKVGIGKLMYFSLTASRIA
jgi:hypothetical protein